MDSEPSTNTVCYREAPAEWFEIGSVVATYKTDVEIKDEVSPPKEDFLGTGTKRPRPVDPVHAFFSQKYPKVSPEETVPSLGLDISFEKRSTPLLHPSSASSSTSTTSYPSFTSSSVIPPTSPSQDQRYTEYSSFSDQPRHNGHNHSDGYHSTSPSSSSSYNTAPPPSSYSSSSAHSPPHLLSRDRGPTIPHRSSKYQSDSYSHRPGSRAPDNGYPPRRDYYDRDRDRDRERERDPPRDRDRERDRDPPRDRERDRERDRDRDRERDRLLPPPSSSRSTASSSSHYNSSSVPPPSSSSSSSSSRAPSNHHTSSHHHSSSSAHPSRTQASSNAPVLDGLEREKQEYKNVCEKLNSIINEFRKMQDDWSRAPNADERERQEARVRQRYDYVATEHSSLRARYQSLHDRLVARSSDPSLSKVSDHETPSDGPSNSSNLDSFNSTKGNP